MTAPVPVLAQMCADEDPFTGAWCARSLATDTNSADGTDWTTPTHEDARRTQ